MKKLKTLYKGLTLFVFLAISFQNIAQSFTELPQIFAPTYFGASVWGDYNKDGNMDFFVNGWRSTGGTTSAPSAFLYRNNGNGTFTEVTTTIIPLGAASAAWGDINNDGFLDLAVAGNSGSNIYATRVYRNNGDGSFTDIQGDFTPLVTPAITWADFNNDGYQDLVVLGGDNSSNGQTKLYINNGNETFTEVLTGISPLTNGAVAAGDLNNDGKTDLVIAGRFDSFDYKSEIYLNQGNAVFVKMEVALEPARYSSIALCDYSGDGFLDVLIAGSNNNDVLSTSLYRNLNGADFVSAATPITGTIQGSVAWGDMNNDGLADVLLTGSNLPTGATRVTEIFLNQGNDVFTKYTGYSFDGLRRSMAQWGDMNNDGKLDIVMTGYRNAGDYITKVYLNNTPTANTPPNPPQNLIAAPAGGSAILSWAPASDAQTTAAALTYNVRIGTSPGASDVISPLAHPTAGKRFVPRFGNTGNTTQLAINNLDYGTYYWSVQTIDAAFEGSTFAPEQTFVVSDLITATFQVQSNGQALAQATVAIGSQTQNTNQNGTAVFNLAPGTYNYTVAHPFHQTSTGNFTITDQSISITVDMIALPAFDLTFQVSGPQGPVANAEIKIANQTLTTNAAGIATIFIVAGTYPYYFYGEGLNQIWGEVTVGSALTVPLAAVPIQVLEMSFNEYFTATTQPLHWLSFDETASGNNWFFNQGRAVVDSDSAGQGVHVKAALITAPINTTGVEDDILLTFKHFFMAYGNNNTASVDYSIDNGPWVNKIVMNQTVGTLENFAMQELILSNIGPLGNQIRFKFSYDDGNNWAERWMIDEVSITTIRSYEMTLSEVLKPNHTQTPLAHFAPFSFGARGVNSGALSIANVYLNVFNTNGDVANSQIVPVFPVGGSYNFVASPAFQPSQSGNYIFGHHFMASGIDLESPSNFSELQFQVTDSTFATDKGVMATGFSLSDESLFGTKFKLLIADDFTSYTVGWHSFAQPFSFVAELYSINETNTSASLVAQLDPQQVEPGSSMTWITYRLPTALRLPAGTYSLMMKKSSSGTPVLAGDASADGRFWTLTGNNLTPINDPATGNLLLRINVRDLGVSVQENNLSVLSLFPNPASSQVVIHNSSQKPFKAGITDALGRIVQDVELMPGQNILTTEHFTDGVYTLIHPHGHLRFIVKKH